MDMDMDMDMGRATAAVSFCGTKYKNRSALYSAVCAIRDGSDATFGACTKELCRLLRDADELPPEPARTLRLRRDRVSLRSKVYYEISADMSDNTTQHRLSLKKACRAAFTC